MNHLLARIQGFLQFSSRILPFSEINAMHINSRGFNFVLISAKTLVEAEALKFAGVGWFIPKQKLEKDDLMLLSLLLIWDTLNFAL